MGGVLANDENVRLTATARNVLFAGSLIATAVVMGGVLANDENVDLTRKKVIFGAIGATIRRREDLWIADLRL
jgi:hypothetical protein